MEGAIEDRRDDISLTRDGVITIVNERGKERESFLIDYGCVIELTRRSFGANLSLLSDPFARPVIAEEDGYLKLTTEEQDKRKIVEPALILILIRMEVFDLIKAEFTNIKNDKNTKQVYRPTR